MSTDDLSVAWTTLRQRLVDAQLLIPTGVVGVYGRSGEFEQILDGVDRLARSHGADDTPRLLQFPPVISRDTFHRSGYLRNFPHLVGPVFGFEGDDRAHAEVLGRLDSGEDYADLLCPSEVVLTPACCYPVYPTMSGDLAASIVVVETRNHCYRHEPSADPMRMQVFQMREHISLGVPDLVAEWRDRWVARGQSFFADLGLDARVDAANDPFFGRGGRLLARSQREQSLKVEFLVDVYGLGQPTACASLNAHQDHFGELFGIRVGTTIAHSSCIGFGLERCAIALLAAHGMSTSTWPAEIRQRVLS